MKPCYTSAMMDVAPKIQFLREKVLVRKAFQISAFVLILGSSGALFFLARTYLDLESFVTYGYAGVFLVNLISCASILFPIPGEAINIAAGATLNPLWVGLVATVGATMGEPTCYLVGYLGREVVMAGYSQKYQQAERWMQRYGSFAIFLFALVPVLIFDLIGIVAGSTRYPLWRFMMACFAGRVLRCLIEAYLGYGLLGLLPGSW